MDAAAEGEELAYEDPKGDRWTLSWHGPSMAPEGTKHGSNAFCVTTDRHVVLVSDDGERFFWPGGRPEGNETWEQTMRREMLEEACAEVTSSELLGFVRSTCLAGEDLGVVLVRSIWRADVIARPWLPEFEIAYRRLVRVADLMKQLWMEPGLESLYGRVLLEARLA